MRILDVPTNDAFFIQHLFKGSHGLDRACHDAQIWTIDQRNREILTEQRNDFRFGQCDREHGTLRELMNQFCPRGDQPQGIFE